MLLQGCLGLNTLPGYFWSLLNTDPLSMTVLRRELEVKAKPLLCCPARTWGSSEEEEYPLRWSLHLRAPYLPTQAPLTCPMERLTAPWGPNQPVSPEHLLAFIVSAGDNCARQHSDTVGPAAAGMTPPHTAQSPVLLPPQEGQQPAGQRS